VPYIGNNLQFAFPSYRNIDDISGSFNGVTTSFSLTVSGSAPVPLPVSSNQCLISVGGVVQRPDDSGTEGFRLSGGNIIFSSAPAALADFFGVILAGADYANAGAHFPNGSFSNPSITFDSDLDTGLYTPGANEIGFTNGGTTSLVLGSTGQLRAGNIGSAGTPTYSFSSDPNTGLYSPGADQLAISTNGTGRLFVDASGNVGIGSAPSTLFDVVSTSEFTLGFIARTSSTQTSISNHPVAGFRNTSSASGNGVGIRFNIADSGGTSRVAGQIGAIATAKTASSVTSDIYFAPGGTERMRLDSSGRLGLGTSSPQTDFVVSNGGASGVEIDAGFLAGNSLIQAYNRSGASFDGLNLRALEIALQTNGANTRMFIDSSGRVGIGVTTVGELLHVSRNQDANTAIRLDNENTGSNASASLNLKSGAKDVSIKAFGNGSSFLIQGFNGIVTQYQDFDTHIWRSNAAAERARIDSSGRLLVGTSTAVAATTLTPGFQHQGTEGSFANTGFGRWTNDNGGYAIYFAKSRGTSVGSQVIVSDGDFLGALFFEGSDGTQLRRSASITANVDGTPGAGDMPGRLVFSTTADGAASPTERMRISSTGQISINSGVAIIDTATSNAPYLSLASNALAATGAELRMGARTGNSNTSAGIKAIHPDGADSDYVSIGLFVRDSGTSTDPSLEIARADYQGSFRPGADNARPLGNASFRWSQLFAGTATINTSDETLKQDVKALDQAELLVARNIKSLIKKFRFKDAVAKKGADARIHVGVIAQEVEQAFLAEGLEPRHYGLFCEDTLEDGSKRLGIRYEELLAFVIAAL
jgi:hypothetical protein